MEIFSCLDLNKEQVVRLRSSIGTDELHLQADFDAETRTRAVFDRCEVVFGNAPADWIAASPALRWVQLESVGFGEYTGLDWSRLGQRIRMTNLAGFFAEPVAESILAGILALYRGINPLVELQRRHRWQGDAVRPDLRILSGANVVLFGYGAINRRVAELLAPFRCKVIPFGRGWDATALDAALRAADIVVTTAPDTDGTRNVFNCDRLTLLKDGALFLNFGRGSVVDEIALAHALETGRLGGAVIDVTRAEPLPPNHRFWTCQNMILTQHSGGGTHDETDRKIETFLVNLDRYGRGEQLQGTVDFSRGY